jgi:hypothetical protein
MEPLPSAEDFEDRLKDEIERAKQFGNYPAIIFFGIKNPSFKKSIEETLYAFSRENQNFSTLPNKNQCLDYIANHGELVGVILYDGNGQVGKIKDNIVKMLNSRFAREVKFDYVGTASYEKGAYEKGIDETAKALIEAAKTNKNI